MIKSKKQGSSLLTMLVYLSIIVIIGMAVSSLALSSLKARGVNQIRLQNMYASEAGLEEAYGLLSILYEEAVANANSEVHAKIIEINHEIELQKLEVMKTGVETFYVDEAGRVKEQQIHRVQGQTFETAFESYFQQKEAGVNILVNRMNHSDNYYFEKNGQKPHISITTPTSKLIFLNHSLTFNVQSEFDFEGFKRKISTSYRIDTPKYQENYYTEINVVKLKKNPAWLNILTIDGDFVVRGQMNLVGNAFVKGSNININGDEITKNRYQSGVLINEDNSRLTIRGNMITPQNLYINSTNSNVNINGNLYTKNTIFDGGPYKTSSQGSALNIHSDTDSGGNIYALDDLKLNSNKIRVVVDGSYYGVSDGSDNIEADHSSAIIINAEDLGDVDGTSLNISNDMIVAGSSFINLYHGEKYQTGESLSISGNYKAYTLPLYSGNPRTQLRDGGTKSLLGHNIDFQFKDPLMLAYKFITEDEPMNVLDKSDYFKAYASDPDYQGEGFSLNLGGTGVDIGGNILFNTGVVIENNTIIGSNPINFTELNLRALEAKNNIFYMAHPKLNDDVIGTQKLKVMVDGSQIASRDTRGLVDYDNITNNLRFKDGLRTSFTSSDIIAENNDIFILDHSGRDFVIIGPDATNIPTGKEYIRVASNGDGRGKLNGLIITNGDLYLAGNIDFKGSIITTGNVISTDDDIKNLVYNETYISKLVANFYQDLSSIFKNNTEESFSYESQYSVHNDGMDTKKLVNKNIHHFNWKLMN